MAEKEAWVFVIDMGRSMAAIGPSRDQSNLDFGMRYIWDKISHIVSLNRKTINVGVIGLRTDETANSMDWEESYYHIQVLQELKPCTLSDVRLLKEKIRPSKQVKGDAISALILATNMMIDFTKKLKYQRRIVLLTDGCGTMDDDDMDSLAEKLKEYGISLLILGIDFDDEEFGFKENNKQEFKATLFQAKTEAIFHSLADLANGKCATVAEAISELDIPNVKTPRPYKTYDGLLGLGTPGNALIESAPNNLLIGIERYFRTKSASPMTASTVVVRAGTGNGDANVTVLEDADIAAVRMARSYTVKDETAPGGEIDVPVDELAKGYEYGRTAVYINQSDENVTTLETKKSFSILGFVEKSHYNTVFNMGESCVSFARRSEPASMLSFATLLTAMDRAGAYAVARFVAKDWKEPQLLLLIPDVEEQCLYDVPLPFSEDLRRFRFAPLDRLVTVMGETVTAKHKLLPDEDLDAAMSEFVDAMDLSTWAVDENSNPTEYITVEENFNPLIHRIKLAVQHRGVYPELPIPPIPSNLLLFSAPADDLLSAAAAQITALLGAANVTKVPPKPKKRLRRDPPKPLSGLDVNALLDARGGSTTPSAATAAAATLSMDNAVPEFKQMLDAAQDDKKTADAVAQMGAIIRLLINQGFGGNTDDRVLEHLGTVRDEMIDMNLPDLYNNYLRELKSDLLAGKLGGDRKELWFKIIKIAKLGLIREDQADASTVSMQQAIEFYT
ncbi:hypothetical protein TD95_003720 [Thielaviopsis punctulata]|uniref:ATP-dependent DNA helicase II subunit 2 n=1 Tax=Thielaviopsis punctulata TaxID=72032 RepID=A0A0F4ZCC8_9PEZI|nr:hypothetical protein TD95_003720 [Thielaviopsis punctulata]